MEECICLKEGKSVRLQELEGVCFDCGSEVESVDSIDNDDWTTIIINLVEGVDIDVDDWLKIIDGIKQIIKKK